MPPVFFRFDPHVYDPTLDSWREHGNSEHRCMALNVRYDHRVTLVRERDAFHPCVHKVGLRNAFKFYKEERIQKRSFPPRVAGEPPDFLQPSLNDGNFVHGLHEGTEFVRVVDVAGLAEVLRWAVDIIPGQFRLLEELQFHNLVEQDRSTLHTRLDQKLNSRKEEDQRSIALEIIQAMNFQLEESLKPAGRFLPYQPVWATVWAFFEPLLHGDPARWLEILGAQRPGVPIWLMVLRYKVNEIGTVVRPTQLDSGWYPEHFPSPPETLSRTDGNTLAGHPMDLDHASAHSNLMPEYLHAQILHTEEHLMAFRSTGRAIGCDLSLARQAHLDLVNAIYPNRDSNWMPEAI